MTTRSPRVTAHLRNTIEAAREQAELAYRFAPNSYTYSAFLAAKRAEALAEKKKRGRAARGLVPDFRNSWCGLPPAESRRTSGTSRTG
jgi:hypothetical protein